MASIHTCDFCDAEVKTVEEPQSYAIAVEVRKGVHGPQSKDRQTPVHEDWASFDLCPECLREFLGYIRDRRESRAAA